MADQQRQDGSGPVDEVPAGADGTVISGLMTRLMRQYGAIRNRITATGRVSAAPTFLLFKFADGQRRRAADLAEELCADPSTVSRQVAQLVKEGFLERQADPDDGRASLLVLTDLGRQRRDALRRDSIALFAGVTAAWSDHDRRTLAELLHRYVEDMESQRESITEAVLASHTGEPDPAAAARRAPDRQRTNTERTT
ncbi:MarR family winged helix-turn-helix transcriptional regulator [Nakamurella aerolata]|nr:MarR family winged helix-turn-helix transcriptional regulator [Nakamurella aerolata]